jgi:hypothetical protein
MASMFIFETSEASVIQELLVETGCVAFPDFSIKQDVIPSEESFVVK